MSNHTKALFAIILTTILWSVVGPFMKIIYKSIDPYPLAFIRFLIAFLFILPIFLKTKAHFKISKLLIFAVLVSIGNIFFFYLGILTTTAIMSTMIYAAVPLIVLVLANLFIKETITQIKLFGFLIGFIGIIFIVLLPVLEKGNIIIGDLRGNLLVFAATVCWSFYTIASRYLITSKNYSPVTLSTATFAGCMIFFGILTFIFPHRSILKAIQQPLNLGLILYISTVATVFTFLLYQWAIKYSSAGTASLGNYLQPVFTIFFSMMLIGENVTLSFIFGALLVFLGLILVSSKKAVLVFNRLNK